MNNEALNEFVKLMTETLKQAKDFTLAQAPEVMKEIIRFEIAQAIAGILLGVFFFVVAYRAHIFLREKIKSQSAYSDWEMGYILVVIVSIVGLVVVCVNSANALEAWLAPRVYLIEYFSHLVRK